MIEKWRVSLDHDGTCAHWEKVYLESQKDLS